MLLTNYTDTLTIIALSFLSSPEFCFATKTEEKGGDDTKEDITVCIFALISLSFKMEKGTVDKAGSAQAQS